MPSPMQNAMQNARHTARELQLLARLALARSAQALVPPRATDAEQRMHASLQVAWPGLSLAAARRLQRRHHHAMHKCRLVQAHLAALAAPELASYLDRHVCVQDRVLDLVRNDPRPVVFVTPHYGPFGLGCLKLIQAIGRHKTVNAFYDAPAKNPSSAGFEALLKGLGYGFNALFNDSTAVLKALRVLKRGEALTMMPDVFDLTGHVLYVPFFGRLVPAMAGTALFAIKSQARVVVGYSCPGDGLQTTVQLGVPIEPQRSGVLEADIASLTAAIFRDMERQIRQAPEHWAYLPGIGDLLRGQLPLGQGRPADWMQALSDMAPLVQADWPDLAQTVRAAVAIQAAAPQASAA